MQTLIRAVLVLAAACVATSSFAAAPAAGPGGVLADLPNFKNFKAARSSSFDPTGGNADGRHDWPIKPGETRTIADIQGTGAITHLWITIASPDKHHLKNLVLRMYWDGSPARHHAQTARGAGRRDRHARHRRVLFRRPGRTDQGADRVTDKLGS